MIISLTGKPCSGKGSVGKEFAQKFNFEYLSTGDIFRSVCLDLNINSILDFNNDKRVYQIDSEVDNRTKQIGKTRLDENILLDSRLAWHFIPNSFKVFLDVSIDEAANRLLNANRDSEPVANINEAKKVLTERWDAENERYKKLYKTDNTNLKNYDLVILTDNKTIEEIVLEIEKAYKKFLKNKKAK